MVNIQHLYKFLKRYTTTDPNRGMPVSDLLEFYNDFCKRQRNDFTLSANIFRGVLEMYMTCSSSNFAIIMINGRTSVIKGLKVNQGDAASLMDLIKYSLLEEDNPDSVKSANRYFKNLNQVWDNEESYDRNRADDELSKQQDTHNSTNPSPPGAGSAG